MKIAMFPGQGCQYIGMGDFLLKKYLRYTTLASEVLGYDFESLCNGTNDFGLESIIDTIYAQPLIYVISCLDFMDHLNESKTKEVNICIGHSLGLYAALFAGGVFSFEKGLEIVKKRAFLMQKANQGAMAAILGEKVENLPSLLISNDFFDIDIANFNGPKQVVISGPLDNIEKVQKLIEENELRYVRLNVSGAFHSRLMESARIAFSNYLIDFEFKEPKIDVISTTNGERISVEFLIEELSYQLIRPVRWYQTVLLLRKKYPQFSFVEFGQSKVLTGLNKYIFINP